MTDGAGRWAVRAAAIRARGGWRWAPCSPWPSVSAAVASARPRHKPKPTSPGHVTRDRNGVAHIVAKNFTALGLGEGYAFAQDNLCTFAADIVTAARSALEVLRADAPGGQLLGRDRR